MYGLAIDAEDALIEYLDTFYHLSLAGKALDRFGAVDFATSIAPGLRDVLLTGKVYEAVRREIKRPPQRLRRRGSGRSADRQDRPVPQCARGRRRPGEGGTHPQPGRLDHASAAVGDNGRAFRHPA